MNKKSCHPLLEVENLTVSFQGRRILDGLSFVVSRGQKVVVKGDSGAGKSTLLKTLMGFVRADSGSIRVDGESLDAESIWRIRGKLAMVQQEPDLGNGRVADIIRRPLEFKINRGIRRDEEHIKSCFSRFLLDYSLLEKDISLLSGGEKQRIALISVLLLERDIFLLDEATSALDARSKKAVFENFCGRPEMTVIAATHDRDFLSACDWIITLPLEQREGNHG